MSSNSMMNLFWSCTDASLSCESHSVCCTIECMRQSRIWSSIGSCCSLMQQIRHRSCATNKQQIEVKIMSVECSDELSTNQLRERETERDKEMGRGADDTWNVFTYSYAQGSIGMRTENEMLFQKNFRYCYDEGRISFRYHRSVALRSVSRMTCFTCSCRQMCVDSGEWLLLCNATERILCCERSTASASRSNDLSSSKQSRLMWMTDKHDTGVNRPFIVSGTSKEE
jgi:hypothetical protein